MHAQDPVGQPSARLNDQFCVLDAVVVGYIRVSFFDLHDLGRPLIDQNSRTNQSGCICKGRFGARFRNLKVLCSSLANH